MSEEAKRKFSELNMTRDELDRFTEAMKKEEFRKLLVEYAEELSDPKNREQYEKEIAQLEEERGMNVTFIHPEKGFCLKTTQNGELKCFINICKNENIEKPRCQNETQNTNGKVTKGLCWEIPHTCSPSREDFDHDKKKCVVYDVVFHPDSYRMGETNERFKDLLKNSAMDTIENSFKVKLDRANAKVLKNLVFKGRPTACVIKKKINDFEPKSVDSDDPLKPLLDQIKEHSLDKQLTDRLDKSKKLQSEKKADDTAHTDANNNPIGEGASASHTAPKYSIVHRGHADMSDHAHQLDATAIRTTRPTEIAVTVQLPLLTSSHHVNLDVFETSLELSHDEPNYRLSIRLPYPVREAEAKAKFDKSKRCLSITLPVVPFTGKLETADVIAPKELISPLSDETSSTSSMSSLSSHSMSPAPESVTAPKSNGPSKHKLPSKVDASETCGFISFKVWANNYVKETLRIKVDSSSSLQLTFESCSLSGCYVQYFASTLQLKGSQLDTGLIQNAFHSVEDLIESKLISFNFNNTNRFEIKLKKDTSAKAVTTTVECYLDDESPSANETQTIQVAQDLTEEIVEQAQISEDKVNNMSRKEYIMSFGEIINEKDGEDEDDAEVAESSVCPPVVEGKKSVRNLENHEKMEFERSRLAKAGESGLKGVTSDAEVSDFEKEYLANQMNSQNEETNEENDADDDADKKQNANGERLSQSSYTSSLMSSLNSNSSTHLKGILKKPRSYSESESSQSSLKSKLAHLEPTEQNSEENLQGSKKCVHFSNQVVRNVFKANATVQGMKKPNPGKNKKKNQRKRTVSDPTSDATGECHSGTLASLRCRSISESTDDDGGSITPLSANSLESINEERTPTPENPEGSAVKTKKKSKKRKNNKAVVTDKKEEGRQFDVETMVQWKSQGLLPEEEKLTHKTECSFKFKNKLLNDLDD